MTNAFNQPMPLKNLSWDPLSENDNQPLSTTAAKRLKRFAHTEQYICFLNEFIFTET